MTQNPTDSIQKCSTGSVPVECYTSAPVGSDPFAAPGPGPAILSPPAPGQNISGGTRDNWVEEGGSQSDSSPQSISSTPAYPQPEVSTPSESETVKTGSTVHVELQAALAISIYLEVESPASSQELAEHDARFSALTGPARDELDRVLLSAARALRLHLRQCRTPLAAGLRAVSVIAGETPTLLVDDRPEVWSGEQS